MQTGGSWGWPWFFLGGWIRWRSGRCLEPCHARFRQPALAREHRLFSAQWLGCAVELEARERPPRNLDPNTWTRPSRLWASVTPVVLNRHFDGKDKWDRAADSVKGACEHIETAAPSRGPAASGFAWSRARRMPGSTRSLRARAMVGGGATTTR